jgi:hypothetical protein
VGIGGVAMPIEECRETTFHGHRCIEIPLGEDKEGNQKYLTMGYNKAKAVVDHMDEIERFCIDVEESRTKGR